MESKQVSSIFSSLTCYIFFVGVVIIGPDSRGCVSAQGENVIGGGYFLDRFNYDETVKRLVAQRPSLQQDSFGNCDTELVILSHPGIQYEKRNAYEFYVMLCVGFL